MQRTVIKGLFVSIGETKVTDYLFTDKNIKTMIMRNINTDLIDAMKIYLPKGIILQMR